MFAGLGKDRIGVADAGKVEAMARTDRTTGGAIAGFEGVFYVCWRPAASSDAFERANKTAHLVVQEAAGADVEVDFRPGETCDTLHAQLIQRFDRALSLAD